MKPEQAKALREPFPKSAIGHKPKGGTMLDFVGHAATTDRLLKVDPSWSWEPFALDERGLPALDSKGNLWIRLTVAGVTRIGVGDGPNAKEVIGDAIRNAAMRFGVALDLWAREDLHADDPQSGGGAGDDLPLGPTPSSPPADERVADGITPAQVKKVAAAMGELGMTDRTVALGYVENVTGRKVESRNDLTKAEAHKVIDALERDITLATGQWATEPGEAE